MRIETCYARPGLDGRGRGPAGRLERELGARASVEAVDVILTDFAPASGLAGELFADPVVQLVAEQPAAELPAFRGWDWLVEIAYRPGVTDTLALTARQALEIAVGGDPEASAELRASAVQTARLYVVAAKGAERDEVERAFKSLWNPLVQSALFLSREDYEGGARPPELYPPVRLSESVEPELFGVAGLDDAGLERLSSERLLALSLPEMAAIRAYYRDAATASLRASRGLPPEATDVELEMIAQTWSEHCKHKIFNAEIEYREAGLEGPAGGPETIRSLFKTYIRSTTEELAPKRPDLKSVFTDNAGVFEFDEGHAVCVKAETHNSPSALDPYGGAITGIVGVNRDILGTGMGAQPLFNTDVLCFAPPATPDAEVPAGLMRPRELLEGVHRGIVDGGNQSGIPVAAGAFVFDPSFMGKPLVFCGTGGIMPSELRGKGSWEKRIEAGMLAVMVGGRVGADGIHGATFSSLALDEASPSSAVQIGDPIIQKRMTDFLLEARDQGLYEGITDNGAGGLSSSLGEMAESAGGLRVDLSACPLKYPGLAPWEILVSESQERMSLAVLPEKMDALRELAARRGVEATAVGEFGSTGLVEAVYGGRLVGLLSLEFLHRGLPTMRLEAEWRPPAVAPGSLPDRADWTGALLEVLADPEVASKEELVRQYDHEVKSISVEKPFTGAGRDAPSDGAVLKPLYGSFRGLSVTHGICPRLSAHDTRAMALAAVDEAYRAHLALGGDPDRAVALDNFCWPDPVASASTPDGAYKLAQLVRACRALREACLAYGLPLVSGKDSMKNDAVAEGRKISVAPTLLVTVVGIVEDVRKALSTDFLAPGDLVYVVGGTGGKLGASILERALGGASLGPCPLADPAEHLGPYRALARAISGKIVRSCHDLSDGGLAAALAESCLGGRLGAEIRLDALPGRPAGSWSDPPPRLPAPLPKAAKALFAEDPGRLLVSIRPEDRERFERLFVGLPARLAGEVAPQPRLRATLGGRVVLDAALPALERAFKTPIA
ncbi:MAG TPA: AIR synthase-related protein [Spirochaetia bacterium]|nr:AIR synthase-related protein [Spirochaetia bacterium]